METSIDSTNQASLPADPPSSRSVFRGIFTGSSVYALALLVPVMAGVLLSPITTRCLTQDEFGLSELLTNVSTVLSALFSVSLSGALGYFYFAAPDAAGRRRAVGTAVVGSTLLGIAGALICWPFVPLLNQKIFHGLDATGYLKVIVVMLPAGFLLDALFTWLRVENRSRAFVTGAVVRVAITVVGILLFVKMLQLHVWGVLITSVSAILIVLLGLTIYWLRHMKPTVDRRLFASMARFSLPLTASSLGMFFLHFGDRFFLAFYWPLSEVAVYSIAYKIGMLMSTAFGAFAYYWGAQVFPIMRRPDADDVFRRVSTYLVLTTSFIGLGLIVFSPPVVRIMYRPEYWGAASLVPVIVLAYFCRSIGDFARALFLVEGHPAYDTVCTFAGAGICLGGYVFLIKTYNYWGAAIATAIAFGSMMVISLVWTHRVRPYSVDIRRLLKIGLSGGAALALHWLVPAGTVIPQIARATASMAVFLSLLWILHFPTSGEWELACGAVLHVRAKLRPAK